VWQLAYLAYLYTAWPKRARWGCVDERDYRVRLKAPRLAFFEHRRYKRVEIWQLEKATQKLGPTTTWGSGWH
jgi:hypothetical protein